MGSFLNLIPVMTTLTPSLSHNNFIVRVKISYKIKTELDTTSMKYHLQHQVQRCNTDKLDQNLQCSIKIVFFFKLTWEWDKIRFIPIKIIINHPIIYCFWFYSHIIKLVSINFYLIIATMILDKMIFFSIEKNSISICL